MQLHGLKRMTGFCFPFISVYACFSFLCYIQVYFSNISFYTFIVSFVVSSSSFVPLPAYVFILLIFSDVLDFICSGFCLIMVLSSWFCLFIVLFIYAFCDISFVCLSIYLFFSLSVFLFVHLLY